MDNSKLSFSKRRRIELNKRIDDISPIIKNEKAWLHKFMNAYPEYNNIKGVDLVRNTIGKKTADEEVISKLEAFAQKVKDENAKA